MFIIFSHPFSPLYFRNLRPWIRMPMHGVIRYAITPARTHARACALLDGKWRLINAITFLMRILKLPLIKERFKEIRLVLSTREIMRLMLHPTSRGSDPWVNVAETASLSHKGWLSVLSKYFSITQRQPAIEVLPIFYRGFIWYATKKQKYSE